MEHLERIVKLETVQHAHEGRIRDHESRLRIVEEFKAQALAYGAIGSVIGSAAVTVLIRIFS